MSAENYQKIYCWFHQNPVAFGAFRALYRYTPLVVVLGYVLLVGSKGVATLAALGQGQGVWQAGGELCLLVGVPAFICLLGTLLRAVLDLPRPYQQAGFVPLVSKDKIGHACPSRHVLSAGVIAVAWWASCPAVSYLLWAVALLIAALRVLAGVHSLRDVLAGLAFGGAGGGVLLFIAYRFLLG